MKKAAFRSLGFGLLFYLMLLPFIRVSARQTDTGYSVLKQLADMYGFTASIETYQKTDGAKDGYTMQPVASNGVEALFFNIAEGESGSKGWFNSISSWYRNTGHEINATTFHGFEAYKGGYQDIESQVNIEFIIWHTGQWGFLVRYEYATHLERELPDLMAAAEALYKIGLDNGIMTTTGIDEKPRINTPTPGAAPDLTPISPQVEIEYTSTGIPYRGVAADGISSLQITLINTDPDSTVTVYPSTDVGELKLLDGRDVSQGNIIIPPLSNQQILYRPPAYISQDSVLTERIKLDIDGDTQVLWGQKASLSFEFVTDDGASAVVQKEILVFRPPVRMVHGYLGSTETWTSMENYLGVNKFMSSSSNYRAAIELMAMDLKTDILRMMEGYDRNGFRVGKVDIVSHSMGGLISRYLVEGDSDPRNLVRKVIMLGTPNHGVDDMFDNARSWGSWVTETHQVAGLQLRYNDPFILLLNEGEREGRHLNPDVEYANIVGQISCLFKKEDGVVPHTSSHLNGVPIYTFADTVHTGAIEYVCDTLKAENKDISITESQLVFAKVRELLLQPIPREQFENASIQVIKGEGEVTVREPDSSQPWELLLNYPAQLEPYYHLQTGNNSKAVIGLYLNQERWGLIALAPNSEIMFRYSSPATVSIWMVKGNARFMARRDNHKKFEIAIGQKYNETWQTLRPQASVFDQDTDFVISVSEQIEVYSLDGRVQIEVQNEDPAVAPQYVQKEINSNQVVSILANTVQDVAQPPAAWWSDEFYPQNISANEDSALSQNWFYWGAIPGVFCLGFAFVLLIIGYSQNSRQIRNTGIILGLIAACASLIAITFFVTSQIDEVSIDRPGNVPQMRAVQITNTPPPTPTTVPATQWNAPTKPSEPRLSTEELYQAATTEGALNVVGLPRDWCNYGEIIDGFHVKYPAIQINEYNSEFGSQDQIEAIKADTNGQVPDVINVGVSYGEPNQALFAPYKVSNWETIPEEMKSPDGYWYGNSYSIMGFLVNAELQPNIPQDWGDLLHPRYKGQIVFGDPRTSNRAVRAVQAAALANGGSLDNVTPGLEFFAELNAIGNLLPITGSTYIWDETPIELTWEYGALATLDFFGETVNGVFVIPKTGQFADLYVQAISVHAPHPNAAKLWTEFLYSDEAQLLYMKGGCRPAREADMRARGVIPAEFSNRLPAISSAVFPTAQQMLKAKEMISSQWDAFVFSPMAPQESSPEASIYSFASCLEPCLSDRTNVRSTFPEKTTKIHFQYGYNWIFPGDDYARVWKNRGEEWVRYQCKWDGPDSGVFESTLSEPAGLRSGEWTMEIYVNEILVVQKSITVEGSHDYWDKAGTINRCK